jgi:hypothetical protein
VRRDILQRIYGDRKNVWRARDRESSGEAPCAGREVKPGDRMPYGYFPLLRLIFPAISSTSRGMKSTAVFAAAFGRS